MRFTKTFRANSAQGAKALITLGGIIQVPWLTLIALFISATCQTATAGFPQTVLLDFDTFTDTVADLDDYTYSAGERTFIVDTLNDKFAMFPVSFTDVTPTTGPFSTVFYNAGLGSSSGIDFQNKKMSDTASLHAPKLLAVAGIPLGTASPLAVVMTSVNIGAHETLHLLGTRHHDAFLPIGFGVSPGEGGADWKPDFPGPETALLTSMEFNSLTTSFGPISAAAMTSPDLLVGPRSAVKLLHDTFIDLDEDSADGNTFATAQPLPLKTIPIPNTLPPGDPLSGLEFFADVVIVEEASIELADSIPGVPPGPESDFYEIDGEAGDLFFIEVISTAVDEGDPVDMAVALLDPTLGFSPVPWFSGGAINDNERETTDSLLLDVTLPSTGSFVIEVFIPLGSVDEFGDYEMLVYRFRAVPEPSTLVLAVFSFATMVCFGYRRRKRSSRIS